MKIVLNRGMKRKLGIDKKPFVSIEPKNSKTSEIIQINDIILGAIGFQKNGYHLLAGARKAKIEISNYIALEAGLANLKENSSWGRMRFTIWNFRLK